MSVGQPHLVTGASGLLGSNLVLVASEGGRDVIAASNTRPCDFPNVPNVQVDLSNPRAGQELLEEFRPVVVIHCAAASDVDWCERHEAEAWSLNVDLTRKLARASHQCGSGFVFLSTDAVFPGEKGGYREEDSTGPVNVYAKSKLAAEQAVLDEHPGSLIVRTNFFGWSLYSEQTLAEWILRRLAVGDQVPAFDDVVFAPLLVNDLSEVILALVDREARGIFHVNAREAVSKYEFALLIAEVFGYDPERVVRTKVDESSLRAPRPKKTWLRSRKLARFLGISLPDVPRAVERFRAMREEGYVKQFREAASSRTPEDVESGSVPVRKELLPYGHQVIDEDDIASVVKVLRSDWITTGPKVREFEERFAAFVGSEEAVSFSSGTGALHGAVFAAGIGAGDEAIVPPLTFCATANCVLYEGAEPVFADVHESTLTIDPSKVAERISSRTRAVLPVDYAGHPADLDPILKLAEERGLTVIEDACHALGAEYRGRRVGAISDMSVFSFHPVKHITTGEGGMVTTNDPDLARSLRRFRNHGIDRGARSRHAEGEWFYEMVELGYNYRLSDIGCALGLSQLEKLEDKLRRRRSIATRYNTAFADHSGVNPPRVSPKARPAWHFYPIRINPGALTANRDRIFRALRAENIGVNVHYIPVHLHPYYRDRFDDRRGDYPVAEDAYERLITLPLFDAMSDADVEDVILAVRRVFARFGR